MGGPHPGAQGNLGVVDGTQHEPPIILTEDVLQRARAGAEDEVHVAVDESG